MTCIQEKEKVFSDGFHVDIAKRHKITFSLFSLIFPSSLWQIVVLFFRDLLTRCLFVSCGINGNGVPLFNRPSSHISQLLPRILTIFPLLNQILPLLQLPSSLHIFLLDHFNHPTRIFTRTHIQTPSIPRQQDPNHILQQIRSPLHFPHPRHFLQQNFLFAEL
jgi:hypothetical protein